MEEEDRSRGRTSSQSQKSGLDVLGNWMECESKRAPISVRGMHISLNGSRTLRRKYRLAGKEGEQQLSIIHAIIPYQ